MLLGVQLLILLSLIRVKQRVMGWASSVFANVCAAYVSYVVLRLQSEPSCSLDVMGYMKLWCLITNEVVRGFYNAGCCAPCLAILSASSFPMMFVWALTLPMVILC